MNVLNSEYPEEGSSDVYVESFTVKYTQDLNSCQNSDDYRDKEQVLTLTTDDAGGGKFIHMTIGDSGWSIDTNEIEDFVKILRHFKKLIEIEPE